MVGGPVIDYIEQFVRNSIIGAEVQLIRSSEKRLKNPELT